jgi:MOSC domain-containing protein YiiM
VERIMNADREGPRRIDSQSDGDPAAFLALDVLEARLAAAPRAPADSGRVRLLVTRHSGGVRQTLERVTMTPESGMPGDSWGRQRRPSLEAQLTAMQFDVADLIANGQPLTLFGDQLFLDLDLSNANLPVGSVLRAGTATLEVTPMPHNGCRRFRARFGDAALRLVSKPELRHLNLRGVYLRVIEPGDIAVGDAVHVVTRPQHAHAG